MIDSILNRKHKGTMATSHSISTTTSFPNSNNSGGVINVPYQVNSMGYVYANPLDKPSEIQLACEGPEFNLDGPIWVRHDIVLTKDMIADHFKRWAAITTPSDYGTIAVIKDGGVILHPAFCSRETFDSFGAWWEIYTARFENLNRRFPMMPCGLIGSVAILKSAPGREEREFCAIYSSLNGDIWLENDRWVFSDERDAVIAKMLFSN